MPFPAFAGEAPDSRVLVPTDPPLQNRTAIAGRSQFYARGGGGESLKQTAFRADDTNLAICDLDALSERAEVVAAISAAIDPHPLPRCPGELADHDGRDRLLA